MSSGFSSTVLLGGDMNDFIAPSQSCVNPIFTGTSNNKNENGKSKAPGLPKIGLQMDMDVDMSSGILSSYGVSSSSSLNFGSSSTKQPNLIIKNEKTQTAKVSLSDCLACSGCVTSAETVLLQQQSIPEFLSAIKNKPLIIMTISTQSLASLSAYLGTDMAQTLVDVRSRLQNIGVHYVIEASYASDIALIEAREEFLQKYKSNQAKMTLFSSECPGWVCFAEKTFPEAIPYISSVRSPQQIAGAILKHVLSSKQEQQHRQIANSLSNGSIYHATVMPCPDKKLEASRKDFFDEAKNIKDVDCVLSTTELLDLLNSTSSDIQFNSNTAKLQLDDFMDIGKSQHVQQTGMYPLIQNLNQVLTSNIFNGFPQISFGGSGGYLEYIFRYAARVLYNVTIPDGPLPMKQGRNSDIWTIALEVDGVKVLHFCAAYGFRNIQSIVRMIKRGECPYHYVEIMACPSGCLNGGGQIRKAAEGMSNIAPSSIHGNELFEETRRHYIQPGIQREIILPEKSSITNDFYSSFIPEGPNSAIAKKLFHTEYHIVPKLESNGLSEKW